MKRPLVEDTPRVDLADVRRAGALEPPWNRGKAARGRFGWAVVGAREQAKALVLLGPALDRVEAVVSLDRELCGFNRVATRYWARCPRCDRRCRVIHRTDFGPWACRVCAGLAYQSSQRSGSQLYEGAIRPLEASMYLVPRLNRARSTRSILRLSRRITRAARAGRRAHG